MIVAHDSLRWLDSFAMKLGQLVPAMPIDEAFAAALQVYPDAASMDPREAAEVYALELPPGGPGWP